jgi:hypothetical protein
MPRQKRDHFADLIVICAAAYGLWTVGKALLWLLCGVIEWELHQ